MSNKLVVKEDITSLVNKISPMIDKSIYSYIFKPEVIDVFKCVIILFALKINKINPSDSIEQIVPLLTKMSGGVDFYDERGNKIKNDESFYTPSKIFCIIIYAIICIGSLYYINSTIFEIKNKIYTPSDVVVGNVNNYNSSAALIPVEQQSSLVPIDQMYNDLNSIYEVVSENPDSDTFKSILIDLKQLSSSIEQTIQSTSSKIPSYISFANPFNYAVANVVGNLLIPENNQLVIKKLLVDKFDKTVSFNKDKLQMNINHIVSEITKEIEEVQKTINELNDPNLIKRANNYIQNTLAYFISPQAILKTGEIKMDKIISILSKIEYIKNDFNVGIKEFLNDAKIIASEYSNELYHKILVLYFWGSMLIFFGGGFMYQIRKPIKETSQIVYQFNFQGNDNYNNNDNRLPQITNKRGRGGRKYAVKKNKNTKKLKKNKNTKKIIKHNKPTKKFRKH